MSRSNHSMAKLRPVLQSLLAQRQEAWLEHPDADALAAFSENKLSRGARKRLIGHMATCPDCREVLSLTPQRAGLGQAERPIPKYWLAAAVPMLVVVVVALIATRREPTHKPEPPVTIAKVEPPTSLMAQQGGPQIGAKPPRRHRQTAKLKNSAQFPLRAPAAPHLEEPSLPAAPEVSPAAPDAQPLPVSETQVSSAFAAAQQSVPPIYTQRSAVVPQAMFAERALVIPKLNGRSRGRTKTLWAVEDTSPGTLIRSDDGGLSWRVVPVTDGANTASGPIESIQVRGGRVTVKIESTFWASDDDGKHWQRTPDGK